jgi:hypothetical protein
LSPSCNGRVNWISSLQLGNAASFISSPLTQKHRLGRRIIKSRGHLSRLCVP